MEAGAVRCWFILFLPLIDKVSLQDPGHITGDVGATVILPCSYTDKVLKPEEINVFWRYNISVVVLNIEKNISSTKEQNAMFKDRIESFSNEKGNFSVKLKNLRFNDTGEFSCSIPKVKYKQNLQVKVRAPTTAVPTSKPETNTRNSSIKTRPDGISTFLAAVLGVYICFCC
ncbi:sodium channel subunit beta-4-like [Puntigrus tetrazona]|uniref:sodium channel subunit beta-4-like n=1 Tax=Puntigrus tetrazona TaxID=1606681 RepID=UPI001C8A75F9|nr:sodium channel subunit beta-4-like [Puntigrus tetrazona]